MSAETNTSSTFNPPLRLVSSREQAGGEPVQWTPQQTELFYKHIDLPEQTAEIYFYAKGNYPKAELEEMKGDAQIGFVKAVMKFEPERVTKEDPDSVAFVKNSINRAIFHGLRSRLGRTQVLRAPKKEGERIGQLIEKGGRFARVKPSVISGVAVSLEGSQSSESSEFPSVHETFSKASEDNLDKLIADLDLVRSLKGLDRTKQEALLRRLYLEQTTIEIGREINSSQMQASRLTRRVGREVLLRMNSDGDISHLEAA